MSRPGPRPRQDEADLYVYTAEDIEQILGDCYVDMREVVSDQEAAECLDIAHARLTDGFYSHRDE